MEKKSEKKKRSSLTPTSWERSHSVSRISLPHVEICSLEASPGTARQDRSAKSGLKISEHGFLWQRDPSERHRTGSGKKSGVVRPRFTAPGGSNRRKLQKFTRENSPARAPSHRTQLSTSAAPFPRISENKGCHSSR